MAETSKNIDKSQLLKFLLFLFAKKKLHTNPRLKREYFLYDVIYMKIKNIQD